MAQWVAHMTGNHDVAGSNPAFGAKSWYDLAREGRNSIAFDYSSMLIFESWTVRNLNDERSSRNFQSGIEMCRNPWERFGVKSVGRRCSSWLCCRRILLIRLIGV